MLNDSTIRSAKPKETPFKLTDGSGLYLEVKPNGSRLWRYRYRIGDKENVFAVGEYCPAPGGETTEQAKARRDGRRFTLAEARSERDRCRDLVKQDIHPAHNQRIEALRRSLENETTFKAVAIAWITENADWSDGYRRQVKRSLERDAYPYIGVLPIKAIKPAHILDVLQRIKTRSPVMASHLKTWIGGVVRYAVGRLLIEDDPTYPLRRSVKLPKVKHHPHLPLKQIGPFLRALEDAVAEFPTVAACKLLWLTVVRTSELRNAEWSEFDFEAGLWSIPAARMKTREEHIVPLSRQARELLQALKAINGGRPYLFPSRSDRTKPMSHEAIRDVFNRIGYAGKFSPHGVRATFSTLCNDMAIRSDVIERCLAHQEGNAIRRAYNRSTLLRERTELMQQWANMLDEFKQGGKVVPLHGQAA